MVNQAFRIKIAYRSKKEKKEKEEKNTRDRLVPHGSDLNCRIEYYSTPHCFACEKFFSAQAVDLKFGGQDPMAGKLNRIEQTGPRTLLRYKGTNQSKY